MGAGLAVTEGVRIQDRENRFRFGESLQKFLTTWLLATVAPGIVVTLLVMVFGPIPIETKIELTDPASIYRGGAQVLGYLFVFGCGLAGSQWWVLRRRLPRVGRWVIMTVVGTGVALFVSQLRITVVIDGDPIFKDPTGMLEGAVYGFILGGLQSRALVEPFALHHRFLWIAVSVFGGALQSAAGHFSNEILLVSLPPGDLLDNVGRGADAVGRVLYFLPTGIAMHRLVVWSQHVQAGHLAARFD